MKRRIALLLVICLLTSTVPAATAGGAVDDGVLGSEIEIVDVDGQDMSMALETDGIELEADGLPNELGDNLQECDTPELEMEDSLNLPENEPLLSESEAQSDALEANDDSADFTIVDGVMTAYNGAGGDVVIPDGVTSIDSYVFIFRSDITSVTIPSSVKKIGDYAFMHCTEMARATVAEGVAEIGEQAFWNCLKLDINIPQSVSVIGEGAFAGCKRVNLSEGNGHYTWKDGILYTGDMKTLMFCSRDLDKIVVPKGTISIGCGAFWNRDTITHVSISDSVTDIGGYAFTGCTGLTEIAIPGSVTSGEYAFSGCNGLSHITIPGKVATVGMYAFAGCEGLTDVELSNGVVRIGERCFSNCKKLASVLIPASVVEISSDAFKDSGSVKIKGYTGSYAQSYAKDMNIPFVPIDAPEISIPKTLTLGVKETYALDAAGASFKSSNAAVASVDKEGVVTAKKAGSATVTVTVGGKKVGTCKVTVVKAPTSISFAEKSVTLGVKETLALKPTITKGSHASYTWSVKNKKIATVDKDGVVTGKKAGKTTVTVKTHNGLKATVTVTVQKAPTKVSLPKKAVTLGVKEALTLTPKIAKGAHTSFTWTVADSKIATVTKSGKVTGKKAGKTTVTVKTHNGKKATVTVTVMKAPTAVSLEAKTMALGVKESVKLKPSIASDAHTSYTWTVKNKKIATVSADGKLTGVKAGKTTVTVKTHNGKKATLTVNVMAAPGSITLSGKSRKLTVGDAIMLMPTLPNKTASRITWSSSKKSVASVDASGVVRALKKGTAKITAKTFNGKKAVCTVTVGEGASYLAFDAEALSVGVKEKVTLKPQVNEGAKVKYTWSTGNKKVATVSKKGVVTGVKAGSTDITVKTQNGLTATVKVTVLAAPKKVTLNKTKAELPVNQTLQLKATLPKKTASQIKWSTSDKKVATVDGNGLVTAIAVGKATITAQTFNGKKATCVVTVREETEVDRMDDIIDGTEDLDKEDYSTSEMTLELLSIEDFDDSEEMAEFIEEYNALANEMNAAEAEYSSLMDELAECLIELDEVMGKTKVTADDSGISISSEHLPVAVTSANEYNASNSPITGRAVVNNIEILLTANGIEEFWDKADTVLSFVNDGVSWIDRVAFVSGKMEDICKKINKPLNEQIESINKKVKKMKANVAKWEKASKKGNEKKKQKYLNMIDQVKPHLDKAIKAQKAWKAAGAFVKWLGNAIKSLIEAHVDAAAALGSDLIKIKHIVEVETHGHPVQGRESVDSVRVKHVQLLDDAKTGAYKAVGMDALWNVTMVITDLMIFSPAGFSKAVFNKYLKKETAQWFINMAKNLRTSLTGKNNRWKRVILTVVETGIDTIVGGNVDQQYGKMDREDDILHGKIRGTISGKVIDADTKKPIAGALVETDEKSKTTKADGSFVLSAMYGDYSGDYAVKCTKEGYEDGTGEVVVDEDNSDVEVTITIVNNGEGTIKGKVVDKNTKKPLSGVKVECENCDTATTNSKGQFTIKKVPIGYQTLVFTKEKYVKETLTVQVEAGKETPVDIAMRLNVGTVKGKVFDDTTKKPLSGVSVSIKNVATVTTDSNGQYTIEKVPVGKQNISFKKENYASDNKTVDVILDVIIPLNIYLKPIDGTIKGTVYDELTKEPLSDVYISCEGLSLSVTTDSKGQYIIEKVPVGKYDITFEKKNFVTATWKTVPVEPNQVTPLDVNLRPEMGTIKGTVVDALTEKALSGVRVESEGYDPVTTDSSGSFTFTDVRVGDRSVSFAKEKYHSTSVAVTVVDGGITSFDLPLVPLLGAVGGIVKDDNNKPMQGVSVTCEGHQEYAAVTDSNGMFLIDNVRIGSYTFVFKADNCDNEKAEVEIIQDTTTSLNITMKLHRGNVAGTVFDYDTKQPLSGVYVISEDGISATTDSNGQYLLEGLVVGSRMIYYSLDRYKSDSMRVNVVKDFTIKQNMELMATIMFFGHYEQDNDTSNGKESIEWIVIGRDSSSVKLLSKAILDGRTYNDMNDSITWEKSNLRTWLNDDFLKAAFTGAEQDRIQTTQVPAPTNPVYTHTDAGGATVDKVYLLSASEAKSVFPDLDIYDRIGNISSYAADKGCMGEWWLRSPGQSSNSAAYVDGTGQINYDGFIVIAGKAGSFYGGFVYGVRPVISLRRS